MQASFVLLSAGALFACTAPHGTQGALGQGAFQYQCATVGCDAPFLGGFSFSAVPAPSGPLTAPLPTKIAVGSHVSVTYSRELGLGQTPLGTVTVEAASPEMVRTDQNGFTLTVPGLTSFVARTEGIVFDFVHVRATPVGGIAVTVNDAAYLLPESETHLGVRDQLHLRAYPLESDGTPLIGDLTCTWKTSDAGVVSITPGKDRATIQGRGAGTATITVEAEGASFSTAILVGQP